MSNIEDWWASYQRLESQRLDLAQRRIQYLLPVLHFLGILQVRVAFDGSGDEGEIHEPTYDSLPCCGLPEGLHDFLRDSCADKLPGGWEINAGSSGVILIDVQAGTCQVEIDWREEEEDWDEEDPED